MLGIVTYDDVNVYADDAACGRIPGRPFLLSLTLQHLAGRER